MRRWPALFLVLVVSGCASETPNPSPATAETPAATAASVAPGGTPLPSQQIEDTAVFDFGDVKATVEIADETAEQQVGLMGRKSMPADHGMLFEFDSESSKAFWMKNTLIPLSIAYMNRSAEGTYVIRSIVDMEPCQADPCKSYPSGADDINSALEMNQGWFAEHDLGIGAEATLKRV